MGSYEPVVIFFRITNLPAMFQDMMNEILRDMINKKKVMAFIEEVLRRLEKNDLYVKPEKCAWKV